MIDLDSAVKEHGDMVLRTAYRILGSLPDAEDVAQNVFWEAYRFRKKQPVTSWEGLLRRLATIRSIDELRRMKPSVSLDNSVVDPTNDPCQDAIAHELAQQLRRAIRCLPKRQAAVISLTYLEQMSRDEIASMLRTTPGAVSTALSKARRKLRFLLSFSRESCSDETPPQITR